jgi:hypothetical protein
MALTRRMAVASRRQNQCVSDSRVVAVFLLPSNVMAESLRLLSALLSSGHTASGSRSQAPSSGAMNFEPGNTETMRPSPQAYSDECLTSRSAGPSIMAG